MSPRTFQESTPHVDEIDQRIAAEMREFRTRVEGEFAALHFGELCEEHPRFVRAASLWMHVSEREIMDQDDSLDLHDARLMALDLLGNELKSDGEDPALLDIIETLKNVTRSDQELPEKHAHMLAA